MTEADSQAIDAVYGVVANVIKDRVFRAGAKVWLVGGDNGDGGRAREWHGLSIPGRRVTKWCATAKLQNFRPAWIPPPMRERVTISGTREEMERWASFLHNVSIGGRAMRAATMALEFGILGETDARRLREALRDQCGALASDVVVELLGAIPAAKAAAFFRERGL